jgi:decaprenyl-phosphate phosphoribosyltransferase
MTSTGGAPAIGTPEALGTPNLSNVARRLVTEPPERPPGPARTDSAPAGSVEPAPASNATKPRAIFRSLRPRQWLKNLLVFVAPAAAGKLGHASTVGHAAAAFAVFSAVASGMYLLNDVLDAEADRHHPVKRHRPVAAGSVQVSHALVAGVILAAGGMAASWFVAGWRMTVVMAVYLGISTAYSLWVKYLPVVELASVASGFVIRAIAGGVATHVPLSEWFLAVTSFVAMFIVTGKRFAEFRQLGEGREAHRQVLRDYTGSFLQSTLTLTATGAVTTYCLWAFDRTGLAQTAPSHLALWTQLTVVPFAIGVLHVLRVLDAGGGSAPEELALRDRWLQVLGAIWALFFLLGIYA